jgi:DNA-binding NarL/FixJ family response regulator
MKKKRNLGALCGKFIWELPMPDHPPASESPRLRVLLVDDNRLLIEGLSNLLAAHGIEVAGMGKDGLEGIALASSLKPDLILMDIRMPHCNGLEATRRIKAVQPELKIVMLTTSAEDDDLFESIKSGACGYLIKSMSGEAFIEALHGLEEGIPPFSPGLAAKLLGEFARLSAGETGREGDTERRGHGEAEKVGLTGRQAEVLQWVAAGLTYKEVGLKLALSERTVRYHMSEIMDRLHLEHRSQVIAYAGKLGLENMEEDH